MRRRGGGGTGGGDRGIDGYKKKYILASIVRVQELRESQGGRPGRGRERSLIVLMVSVDVKQH